MDEVRLTIMEHDMEYLKHEIQDMKELRETVAIMKQSVELLNRTVWGICGFTATTFIGAFVYYVMNILQ